jgi:hypothetical protein
MRFGYKIIGLLLLGLLLLLGVSLADSVITPIDQSRYYRGTRRSAGAWRGSATLQKIQPTCSKTRVLRGGTGPRMGGLHFRPLGRG